MKATRRNFLKQATFGAGVVVTTGFVSDPGSNESVKSEVERAVKKVHKQVFNMSGYAAPKIETVRVGFVGLGDRGSVNLKTMLHIEGMAINALCDKRMSKVEEAQKVLYDSGWPVAKTYGGSDDVWKEMCQSPNLDLIHIAVPRGPLHTQISVYAMEWGKHVAVEVPAASTIEEAWQLVETSERTRKHCLILENCCYDFFELLTLSMVRQGYFGDLIHADAGYIHHQNNFGKRKDGDMWRLKESQHKNGNLYPTHGLGPVCQAMDINRGDRLIRMVSMSSIDFMMGKMATDLAQKDSFYKEFDTNSYRGNMNTSILRTEKGRTIMLQYDITSPREYSRIHLLSGTKGAAMKYPLPERISLGGKWLDDEKMKAVWEVYSPEIIKRIGETAKQIGGHGGMDFLLNWRLIDCLRNGLPIDQDVYDAALWSCIIPLSEWSVSNGSKPIDIPDFTCGSYKTNTPVDISLSKGGNTGIRLINNG